MRDRDTSYRIGRAFRVPRLPSHFLDIRVGAIDVAVPAHLVAA